MSLVGTLTNKVSSVIYSKVNKDETEGKSPLNAEIAGISLNYKTCKSLMKTITRYNTLPKFMQAIRTQIQTLQNNYKKGKQIQKSLSSNEERLAKLLNRVDDSKLNNKLEKTINKTIDDQEKLQKELNKTLRDLKNSKEGEKEFKIKPDSSSCIKALLQHIIPNGDSDKQVEEKVDRAKLQLDHIKRNLQSLDPKIRNKIEQDPIFLKIKKMATEINSNEKYNESLEKTLKEHGRSLTADEKKELSTKAHDEPMQGFLLKNKSAFNRLRDIVEKAFLAQIIEKRKRAGALLLDKVANAPPIPPRTSSLSFPRQGLQLKYDLVEPLYAEIDDSVSLSSSSGQPKDKQKFKLE